MVEKKGPWSKAKVIAYADDVTILLCDWHYKASFPINAWGKKNKTLEELNHSFAFIFVIYLLHVELWARDNIKNLANSSKQPHPLCLSNQHRLN